MLAYSDYTYQLGLIDVNAKAEMQKLEMQGKNAIQEKHFIDAFYVSTHCFNYFQFLLSLKRFNPSDRIEYWVKNW